jgi:peptidoglycan-associated lipoprotein
MTKKDESLAPAIAVAPVKAQTVQVNPDRGIKSTPSMNTAEMGQPSRANQAAELKAELQKVYFNFDSADLSGQARNTLVKNGDLLKKIAKGKIRVEGNCDERGSDDYNLALGEKRAKEAVQYLTNLGIPAERFTVVSYGKEKPVALGHDEASWAKNRRDEFVVLP